MNARHQRDLLETLRERFERHPGRHPHLAWAAVSSRLQARPAALVALERMEATGGEPDVVELDEATASMSFVDCAIESPSGRRSLCYDNEALQARKENKPTGSVIGMAASMGIELLTEAQYRQLQRLGEFDLKTSSWVKTPADVRSRGGSLFCDRRYGLVFLYHNGAQSYYAARGFRGVFWL